MHGLPAVCMKEGLFFALAFFLRIQIILTCYLLVFLQCLIHLSSVDHLYRQIYERFSKSIILAWHLFGDLDFDYFF